MVAEDVIISQRNWWSWYDHHKTEKASEIVGQMVTVFFIWLVASMLVLH